MDSQPTIPMDLTAPPLTQTPPPPAAITTVSTTEQIPNHTAQVANPTPNHTPAPNHPPYAEMITSAVAALKEQNGSSKKAIGKYIDQVYTNLPSTHAALLTHHLKRLKSNGQLIAVKHSYKLPPSPRSAPLPDNAANSPPVDSSSAQPKKRGRPSKPKPNSVSPTQAQVYNDGLAYPAQPVVPQHGPAETYNITAGPTQNLYNVAVGPTPVVQKRKPGRPAKPKPAGATPAAQNIADPPAAHYVVVPPPAAMAHNSTLPPPPAQSNGSVFASEAVFVSLGLVDGPPTVRRRGRPRKMDSAGPQQPRPKPLNQSGVKRTPGRPAKNGLGLNGVAHVGSISGRPRGRPKRVSPAVINGPVLVQPKKRGRKPKNAQQASGSAAVVPPAAMFVPHREASGAVPCTVIVPYAPVPDTVPVAGNGVPPAAAGKRRGRPPKAASAPKKPRKVGKPLGRPKKNVSPPHSSQHLAAYLEIKGKLEYLQTRIKETISVLKPCIENGLPPSALGALEQLEELVTVATDDAAVNVQDQQPVQQQV